MTKSKTPKKRKYIDWDSIEPLYRAGQMSLNEICNQYASDHVNSQVWKTEVRHQSICQKAKDKKWSKNIGEKVKDMVREKLTANVTATCSQTENEMISEATKEPLRVAFGQRARTQRLLDIQDKLMKELEESNEKIMPKVKGFKNIAVAVKALHADQAEQYKLNDTTTDEKTRIQVRRIPVGG